MIKNKKIKFLKAYIPVCLLGLSIILFSGLPLLSREPVKPVNPIDRIEWKKVPRAFQYYVEIKDARGKLIVRTYTKKNYYDKKLKPGVYRVRITVRNKLNKKAGRSNWFRVVVKKPVKPVFSSLSEVKFSLEETSRVITVNGEKFEKGCIVFLKKEDREISPEKTNYHSNEKISIIVNPSEIGEGLYDLVIINPGGESMTEPGIIEISTPEPPKVSGTADTADVVAVKDPVEDPVKDPGKESNEKAAVTDGLLDLHGLYVGPGYVYSVVFPEWNSYIDNAYLGISLYGGYDLNNFGLLKKIPVVNQMGVEVELLFVNYPCTPSSTQQNSSMTALFFAPGLYYKENFSLPVDFLIRGDFGFVRSFINTDNETTGSTASSSDYYFSLGLAVRWVFLDYFFIEAGADYRHICYINSNDIKSFCPVLRAGVRL
ncbi:MAG: porin family protein [bacterium]|nr:porin family protein [bacterium]